MPQVIQLRRGTAAQWTTANPLLAAGEIGLELDTRKWKVGDGTANWTALPYTPGLPAGGTTDQILTKTSGTDYATAWTTPASGSMNWKGAYSAAIPYLKNEVVSYSSGLYIAPANINAGVTPGTNPATVVAAPNFDGTNQTFLPVLLAPISYSQAAGTSTIHRWYFDVTTAGTITIDITYSDSNTTLIAGSLSTNLPGSGGTSDIAFTATVQRYFVRIDKPFSGFAQAGTIKIVEGTGRINTSIPVGWERMI